MKRKQSRLRIRIFYGLLIIPTVLWIILSIVGLGKKLDFDTGEKRNKHQMAEDTSLSNVTAELEASYNDRVPFRSVLLKVFSTVNWLTELPYTKVIEPTLIKMANASMGDQSLENGAFQANAEQEGSAGNGADSANPDGVVSGSNADSAITGSSNAADSLNDNSGTDPNAAENAADPNAIPDQTAEGELQPLPAVYENPVESGYYPYKEVCPEVIQGRDNWLFTTESYMDFTGESMPSDEALASKLAAMEQLNQICQSKGKQLYIVALPNKNAVYPEYMPSVEYAEYSALNALEDYVHANSAVNFHYLDDEMLGAKNYGRLYYMHDTHWNNRGGLAAYSYIRNILGMSSIDLNTIASNDLGPYNGDLQQYTGLPDASFETENAMEMLYKQEVPQQLVRGADDYIDELVAQGTERGETVVMVGDSYRHSLLPYLSRDFAHVYSLNEKRMSPEMADILNFADIIILEGVERNIFFEVHYDNAVESMIGLMG